MSVDASLHQQRRRACEGIATSARSRGRGNLDFAKLPGLSMGKVWIPASAGMSGWRGFVLFRSFLHTLFRGDERMRAHTAFVKGGPSRTLAALPAVAALIGCAAPLHAQTMDEFYERAKLEKTVALVAAGP